MNNNHDNKHANSNSNSNSNNSNGNGNSNGNSNSNSIDKKYENIINKLDTFDILLFNGQDYWFSYIVEFFTYSKFSHIGLVLKDPTYIDPSLTGTYFLESGSEVIPDVEDGKIKFGVQITDLNKVLQNYTGHVYYRKLQIHNADNSISPFINGIDGTEYGSDINNAYKSVYDAPYDDNVIDLLKADIGVDIGNNQRTNDFFCSAFVTYMYTKLGILSGDIQWDLIEPKEYAPNGLIDKTLKALINNNDTGAISLGAMVKIK